jgi:PAS domain-containing protein
VDWGATLYELIKPTLILVVGSALTWIGQRVYKWFKAKREGYEKVHTTLFGTLENPGLIDRYTELVQHNQIMETDIRSIRDEVRTNGGQSLKDTVNKINDTLQYIEGTLRVRIDRDLDVAHIKMDPYGMVIWASRSYALWLGRPTSELKDLRWMSYIHTHDRVVVRQEWDQALLDKRSIDLEFRLWFDPESTYYWVRCLVDPMFSVSGKLLGWYGTFTRTPDQDRAG